jgi:hypothetical protein
MPQSFWDDTQAALMATGVLKKDADAMLETLRKSGQTFGTIGDAIMAAYQRPTAAQSQPAATVAAPQAVGGVQPAAAAKPAFDPIAEAQKRLDAERRKEQIDAAYAKLNPPTVAAVPAFDPTKEAGKQREAEVRKEQIKAAYDQMYGAAQQTKSAFDVTLDVAQKMRGTIGGVFGTLAGALLDVVAAVQDAKGAAQTGIPASGQNPSLPSPAMPSTANVPIAAPAPTIPTAAIAPPALPGATSAPVAAVAPATPVATQAAPVAASGGAMAALETAGPIAAIAGAALAVVGALRDAAMGIVRGAGDFASLFASADASAAGSTAAFGEATKSASASMFLISPALSVLGSVAGEAASSLGKFMKAVDATADRYGDYSPVIAQAQAQSEIRQVLADMRRAQTAGPELARYIQARSDLQQQFEEAKIKILVKLLPIAENLMAIVGAGADNIEGIWALFKLAFPSIETAGEALQILADFARWWRNQQESNQLQDMATGLIGPQIQGGFDANGMPIAGQGQGMQLPQGV